MAKVLGRNLFFALLLTCSSSALAVEPILMLLLSMAKEMATSAASSAVEAAIKEHASAEPPKPETYPGTTVEVDALRRLVNDSFLYLSEAQRTEIFEALHAELMKPENFAVRAPMIDYFARRALQVRAAQLKLAALSTDEKRVLAAQFGKEVKGLPEDDREQLRDVLDRGLLPVPSDLSQLFRTALED